MTRSDRVPQLCARLSSALPLRRRRALTAAVLLLGLHVAAAAWARPMGGGGFGGPASGAGARPGAGWGAPGGPASGAGVRPGAGWGAPGAGLTRPAGPVGVSRWTPTWVAGGYWAARPWVWGWYRVNPAVWAWWPASAAAWGVGGLAAAATLTALVNDAIASQSTVIVVPQTTLILDFGSVQAVRPMAVRFAWAAADAGFQQASGDCQAGLLNGAPPAEAAQAQLLNAACHVAYGAP